jgi:hypothetical protein
LVEIKPFSQIILVNFGALHDSPVVQARGKALLAGLGRDVIHVGIRLEIAVIVSLVAEGGQFFYLGE